jgi:hypothetical protein
VYPVLGVQLGHTVSGGHKYRGIVFQVKGLGVGFRAPPCKNPVVRKSKEGCGP